MSLNKVFIATSIDGYIADLNGNINWLNLIPNPDQIDMGYSAFINEIDALVMGRNTFETILGFEVDWPYQKPVFVLSNTLKEVPENLESKVSLISGSCVEIVEQLSQKGFTRLYIDGGKTIQNFLNEDLIDEMTITIIPILLGDGIPLFGKLAKPQNFQCSKTQIFLDQVVQNKFVRKHRNQ